MPLRLQKIHLKRWLLMQWAPYMFRTFRGNRRPHIKGLVFVFSKETPLYVTITFMCLVLFRKDPVLLPKEASPTEEDHKN